VVKIYRDPANDLAILKIEASNLPTVLLGDSDNLVVGQFALAIGTALGEFRQTVTSGIISGLGRGVTTGSIYLGYVERLDNVIQTDAAINLGNSGGPLLNSSGQVIGINVAIAQDADNISFAIPINVARAMLDNFYRTGEFNRPYLGVRYTNINKTIASANQIPEGAYILEITPGSAADQGDLVPGDIIITIDGQKVIDTNGGIAGIVNQKSLNDLVKIEYYRQGEFYETVIKLTNQE
jgi:S1-C subfamily serine protease